QPLQADRALGAADEQEPLAPKAIHIDLPVVPAGTSEQPDVERLPVGTDVRAVAKADGDVVEPAPGPEVEPAEPAEVLEGSRVRLARVADDAIDRWHIAVDRQLNARIPVRVGSQQLMAEAEVEEHETSPQPRDRHHPEHDVARTD